MTLTLFIVALVFAVAVGFFTKVNSGYVAIVLAVVLGVYACDFTFGQVLSLWPLSLFMMLLMVMMFYGFAIANGTLAVLSETVTYAMRKVPFLLPVALWLFCLAVSACGVGPFGVFAILGPTIMAIGMRAGIPRLLAAVTVISGGSIGAMSPISTGGIVVSNYAKLAGLEAMAEPIVLHTWFNLFVAQGLIFVLTYIAMKGWKRRDGSVEKPAPLNGKQKTTLWIILLVLVLTFVPKMLGSLTGVELFVRLGGVCDVTATSTLGVILCSLLGVASEKEAVRTMPMPIIMLVSGMCLLINTAVEYGLVEQLSAWISAFDGGAFILFALIGIAAIMSFFSSTLGVVVPTLSTLIPAIGGLTGADLGLLFSLIVVAGMLAGYSPFSSSGGITMSGVQDEGERRKLYVQLLCAAPVLVVGFMGLVAVGVIR